MILVVENIGGSRFELTVKKAEYAEKKRLLEGWGLKIIEVRSRQLTSLKT